MGTDDVSLTGERIEAAASLAGFVGLAITLSTTGLVEVADITLGTSLGAAVAEAAFTGLEGAVLAGVVAVVLAGVVAMDDGAEDSAKVFFNQRCRHAERRTRGRDYCT